METEMGAHIKKDHAWLEDALEQSPQTRLEFPAVGETTKHRVIVAGAEQVADYRSDQHQVIVDWKKKPAGSVKDDIGLLVYCSN
jgi:hypothetical protein